MILLDTDILIDFQREYPPALVWFRNLGEVPTLSGLVMMELVQAARNQRELLQSLKLAASVNIEWPINGECLHAFDLFVRYHLSNRLGLIDSFVAAMAIHRTAELCTFNVKHFRAVPGLKWRIPYNKL